MRRSGPAKIFVWLGAGPLVAFMLVSAPLSLSAQGRFVPISISIASEINPELIPLIYVDGALSGAIDGTVLLPDAAESIIEIGFPQAKQPLYSLRIGPENFKSGLTEVIMTSYSYQSADTDALWASVRLGANTIAETALKNAESGGYALRLLGQPYDAYKEIMGKLNLDRSGKDWMEGIPQANDESKRSDNAHTLAVAHEDKLWSGSYTASVRTSWPPPTYRQRKWKVQSDPAGAKIKTQVGDMGATNQTIQLPDLLETFVVLQLPGYIDCPYNSAQCTLSDTDTVVDLRCTLKKK